MSEITQQELKSLFHERAGELWWIKKFWNRRTDIPAGFWNKTRNTRRRCIKIEGKKYFRHRLIWIYHNGEIPEGMEVDHIDQDTTNDHVENLRVVSRADNLKNKTRYENNTSGCAGVCWFRASKKWSARINKEGKKIHLGYFENFEDAVQARKKAERELGFHENHGNA